MDNKHYHSLIEFKKSSLEVTVEYEQITTRKEVESVLDYFQWRFSQKTGKEVPREEIKVNLTEGDVHKTETYFCVRLNEPIYGGLILVHQRALYVLPKLVEELTQYHEDLKPKLKNNSLQLIEQCIVDLKNIIEQKDTRKIIENIVDSNLND